ncbi:PspC domain-containing protein [Galactobacter caseinivorans]|uniref:PspC domain-containing protein n=1 Tax=Galactobacter caseinivorans TaxID=2676123 RepID=A0A496PLP7_9MICC|nr:PspC domain-containing protein [Galactobacter caseinivorans]RKW71450.1 PspC domain-containing protein [Galactobacter caseinivorans]
MQPLYRALRAQPFRRGPRRWLGGICAAVAQRFGWDANLVRLITLVLFLLPVIGVGLYAVLWLVLPWSDESIPLERLVGRATKNRPSKNGPTIKG